MAQEKEDIIICRCQEVTREEILQAIAEGATTVDGVNKRTRAGMGLCQGKTCERLVAKIVSEQTGKPLAEVFPPTFRAPVRPVATTAFLEEETDGDKI